MRNRQFETDLMENKRVFVDFTFHANHLWHKFGICIASPEMCDCAAAGGAGAAGAAACSMYPLLQHSVEFFSGMKFQSILL